MSRWQDVLNRHAPLALPSVHDPLTARLALRAGFPAVQVGTFALAASRVGLPDLGLVHAGESAPWVRDVIRATPLPCLADGDDGGGDPAGAARSALLLEEAGAAAVFLEDQAAPKRCGHLPGKRVVPPAAMAARLLAARRVLSPDTFLLARTDAYDVEGLEGCRRRARAYLRAGADGLYFEGVSDESDLAALGKEFRTVPLALSVLEGNGHTGWRTPREFYSMGYAMVLYPTTVLFRALRGAALALEGLRRGEPTPPGAGLSLADFEPLVGLREWDLLREQGESGA